MQKILDKALCLGSARSQTGCLSQLLNTVPQQNSFASALCFKDQPSHDHCIDPLCAVQFQLNRVYRQNSSSCLAGKMRTLSGHIRASSKIIPCHIHCLASSLLETKLHQNASKHALVSCLCTCIA